MELTSQDETFPEGYTEVPSVETVRTPEQNGMWLNVMILHYLIEL
jgi:hypothetical protein